MRPAKLVLSVLACGLLLACAGGAQRAQLHDVDVGELILASQQKMATEASGCPVDSVPVCYQIGAEVSCECGATRDVQLLQQMLSYQP